MKLLTIHGRKHPDERMQDWGFDGPTLEGIVAVHSTYGNLNAFFNGAGTAQAAHKLTGWKFFDDHALEMEFHEDLLVTRPEGGEPSFYGDWELQESARA